MAILLHVGYHKTATSFLQQRYFADEANGFVRWPSEPTDINRMFASRGPFGEVDPADIASAHAAADEAEQGGRVLVISHERLSGHPSSGGFDAEIILRRLTEAFPGAKVLVTIREQVSMILSVYGQYVREGGSLSLKNYLSPVQPDLHRVPAFDPRFFEYSRLISSYQRSFGADSVLVLPYELLKADPEDFTARIAAHAGTSDWSTSAAPSQASAVVNRGDGPTALQMLRVINGPVLRSQFSPSGITEQHRARRAAIEASRRAARAVPSMVDSKLSDRDRAFVERVVAGRYDADNRRIEEIAGVDLARHGYAGTGSS